MTNQTQDYITLKPIAERFKEVAMSISDDEIKSIIKEELFFKTILSSSVGLKE